MLISLFLISLAAPAQLPAKAAPAQKAEGAPPAKPAPKFRFAVTPDSVQHLGSVGPKEVRTLAWVLKNTSDKPITFRVLDTAPGVRVPLEPFQKAWQPGESRKIEVTSDPSDFLAYQRRAVRLEPDDPSQPRYILRWDMMVRPEMAVDAANKSFGEVAPHESPLLSYTFTREGGGLAEIRLESKLPDYLESEVAATGPKAALQLTLRPSKLKPGMQAGLELLKVSTNAPQQPAFDLTLAWRLKLPILPVPSRVVWDEPKVRDFKLELKSRDGKPFRILEARIEGPKDGQGKELFTCGALPVEAAKSHELQLRCSADLESKGMLFVTCSGLDAPLQIPLSWLPPKAPADAPKPPVGDPKKGDAPETR
ncbi:MAG: hypothetical protein IPQ13_09970 [Holophagaceae bacterium]|nr:hypothetical protein [Holophagaceae bacterium]